jgi:hypothetical protein
MIDRIAQLLIRMHDSRWTLANDIASLDIDGPGPLQWRLDLGMHEAGAVKLRTRWQAREHPSMSWESSSVLGGSELEIVQSIMSRVPLLQRSTELAFTAGQVVSTERRSEASST